MTEAREDSLGAAMLGEAAIETAAALTDTTVVIAEDLRLAVMLAIVPRSKATPLADPGGETQEEVAESPPPPSSQPSSQGGQQDGSGGGSGGEDTLQQSSGTDGEEQEASQSMQQQPQPQEGPTQPSAVSLEEMLQHMSESQGGGDSQSEPLSGKEENSEEDEDEDAVARTVLIPHDFVFAPSQTISLSKNILKVSGECLTASE